MEYGLARCGELSTALADVDAARGFYKPAPETGSQAGGTGSPTGWPARTAW
jgi:hypothetical protein